MEHSYLGDDFRIAATDQLNVLEKQLHDLDEQIRELGEERRSVFASIVSLRQLLEKSGEDSELKKDPLELAFQILLESRGEDIHFKELAKEVVKLGGVLSGAYPANALNRMMNSDSRFVRPRRRGHYALRQDYPDLKKNVGARRRKRTQSK